MSEEDRSKRHRIARPIYKEALSTETLQPLHLTERFAIYEVPDIYWDHLLTTALWHCKKEAKSATGRRRTKMLLYARRIQYIRACEL